jgi:hypothetical protein
LGQAGVLGEMHGTRRQVEGVRMPLEYVLAAVEVAAQPVAIVRRRWDAPGTSRSRARYAAARWRRALRPALRAEADAEDRDAAFQRLLDGQDFGRQMREAILLVDVHGPGRAR